MLMMRALKRNALLALIDLSFRPVLDKMKIYWTGFCSPGIYLLENILSNICAIPDKDKKFL
jgi:hypothetical protein